MNDNVLNILLIEDNRVDALLLKEFLADSREEKKFELIWVDRLAKGLAHLSSANVDAVLLDLNLPDSAGGIDTFLKLQAQAAHIPIILMTGLDDENLARRAVSEGAQDYLVKGQTNRQLLEKAIRYAIERKQAEKALATERTFFRTLMDNIPDAIYFKDAESHFTRINLAQAHRFSLSDPEQAIGKTDFDFFTEEHARQTYEDEQNIMRSGQPVVGKDEKETWPDGRVGWVSTTKMPLRDPKERIVGTFGISRDISERVQMEKQLAYLATHDTLTNLPNRALLQDRIQQALNRSKRHKNQKVEKWEIGVVVIDLDGFKKVNDTFGHATGDLLLQAIAGRLQENIRQTDTVARMGGDEFILLFENITGDRDAVILAKRMLSLFSQPFDLEGHTIKTTASIGLSLYPQDGEDFETLFIRADEAMYEAKRIGNTYCCYSQGRDDKTAN